jgi:ABC-type phosphate transport system ATPase subunit
VVTGDVRPLAAFALVVLLDRPCASLDFEASARPEEPLDTLREQLTLVVAPSALQ